MDKKSEQLELEQAIELIKETLPQKWFIIGEHLRKLAIPRRHQAGQDKSEAFTTIATVAEIRRGLGFDE